METKRIFVGISKKKWTDTHYNLMRIYKSTDVDGCVWGERTQLTDSISIKIPEGVTEIKVEALDYNKFNIFYRIGEGSNNHRSYKTSFLGTEHEH